MSSLSLRGNWTLQQTDPPALWRILSPEESPTVPLYVSDEGGVAIAARAIDSEQLEDEENLPDLPFIEQSFDPPLVLVQIVEEENEEEENEEEEDEEPRPSFDVEELRFWLRSSRVGDGRSEDRQFYLAFEIVRQDGEGDDAVTETQRWFIPVRQQNNWELHSLWLGDIPVSLLQRVTSFRLRSLDVARGFQAVLGDVIATTPEPIQDVDAEFLSRLDAQFQVNIEDTPTPVPAFVELPENPGARTPPYILITPWAVQLLRERGGSGDLTDNYRRQLRFIESVDDEGNVVEEEIEVMEVARRPARKQALVGLAIDVFAENRLQKAQLLDAVLADFSRRDFLVINGEPLDLSSFTPDPEQVTDFAVPGRTPLYIQLTVQIEAGDRQFTALAERPLMRYNHLLDEPSVEDPETVLI